ncbi:DUF411 domain-containing protein [Belnapia sp. F-4-1]|uniref:DUF411 domain-containing protein n=1 Tax=Belnapia sp. F-4-1 TaxID=1545443 RepID=UPI0005B8E6F5|nr:DUF411 domain-containing protein [Belnapia sp. F-4-1]
MTGNDIQVGATSRRGVLVTVLTGTLLSTGLGRTAQAASVVRLEVWQDPNCGCCEGWVAHMRAAGFEVAAHQVADVVPIKVSSGIPEALWSCHTARVDGYVIEGHVPAADVRRLLAERPRAKGLSAPGMPPSSPGMDIPGTPYEVILFGAPGGERIWARH